MRPSVITHFGPCAGIRDLRRAVIRSITVPVCILGLIPAPVLADESSGSVNTSIMRYDKRGDPLNGTRHTGDASKSRPTAESRAGANRGGTPVPAGATEAGLSAPPHEAREILVSGLNAAQVRRVQVLGFSPVEEAPLPNLGMAVWRLATPFSATTPNALTAFRRAIPGVTADYNTLVFTSAATRLNEGARAVGWGKASRSCGAGVRIGMIDSPVDVDHIALRGRRITQRGFLPPGKKEAPALHGTAIAALLVGDPDVAGLGGLIPGASLYAASIFEQRKGIGTVGNLLGFLRALDWMAGENVAVLNMSLETVPNRLMAKGLDKAGRRGLVMAAAAGNGGSRAAPAYPAAHPQVLAVTAVSTQLRAFRQANRGAYIDFSAPGVHIWTAAPGGGGRYQSGTSLAVPFVTAVAALHSRAGASSNPELIRNALIPKVRDLGVPGKDDVYGWGLIRFKPKC